MVDFTLITGACGGLGGAFCDECAARAENLLLCGTSEERLGNLRQRLENDYPNIKIKTHVCDLSSSESREALILYIKAENIVVTKLINNAGVIIEGDMLNFSDSEIADAILVNCVGTVDLTKKIIELKGDRHIYILTVSSLASFYPIPHMAVYAATKSMLSSMMMALSYEFDPRDVTITTVCPGGMATTPAMKESIKSMGFGGKLSALPVRRVAKLSLKALEKGKKLIVPGTFNKILAFFSKIFPKTFLASNAGKIYKKSQKKRNFSNIKK